jgi:hypothetical protein
MKCALIVQTCDKYVQFWPGFFNFMEKHWDEEIGCSKYFCNEELDVSLPEGFKQIKTGRRTFAENLRTILQHVEEENVFYMLEDFWPTAPMSRRLFEELYSSFLVNKMDALQVSSYLPYYSLSKSDLMVGGKNLLEFNVQSEWLFNFQARFWKRDFLAKCIFDPDIPESEVGSAITVEVKCDQHLRKNGAKVFLHHYHWYPISGVAYRGNWSEVGAQMENTRRIDERVSELFYDSELRPGKVLGQEINFVR